MTIDIDAELAKYEAATPLDIVCTEPPDDGVILLSEESPCHPDPVTGIATYDHAHFSPLGDALIELWSILNSKES